MNQRGRCYCYRAKDGKAAECKMANDANRFGWHSYRITPKESQWILGNPNEPCKSVCERNHKTCNAFMQTQINTEEEFDAAMYDAVHNSGQCKEWKNVSYSGAPLWTPMKNTQEDRGGDRTCAVVNQRNFTSKCDLDPLHDDSRLCYCEGKSAICRRDHRLL